MNRYLNITTILGGIWWSTILFDWAVISDPHSEGTSLTLPGTEISQTLTLTPAIVLLVALIARYRKIPNQVMFFAAIVGLASSYAAFTLNAAASPAAIQGLEKLTGIAGVVGSQNLSFAPLSYAFLAIVVSGSSVLAALANPKSATSPKEVADTDPDDPRTIWDSQS